MRRLTTMFLCLILAACQTLPSKDVASSGAGDGPPTPPSTPYHEPGLFRSIWNGFKDHSPGNKAIDITMGAGFLAMMGYLWHESVSAAHCNGVCSSTKHDDPVPNCPAGTYLAWGHDPNSLVPGSDTWYCARSVGLSRHGFNLNFRTSW